MIITVRGDLLVEFITLTAENLTEEHLCCIIRSKKIHPGVEAKRKWLADRLQEGHVFRKLNAKGCCFIEYAPLETAWVPIEGNGFLYIYCLWVDNPFKGQGYATALMESCIADAKAQGRSGICMLGAKKQKNWLSNQAFAKKFGFKAADSTENGYELLTLSFDGTMPHFVENAKRETIEALDLTIYYDFQCPFIAQKIEDLQKYSEESGHPIHLICVDTLEKAKTLPCVFNNWAAFYQGKFVTVNLLDVKSAEKLLNQ